MDVTAASLKKDRMNKKEENSNRIPPATRNSQWLPHRNNCSENNPKNCWWVGLINWLIDWIYWIYCLIMSPRKITKKSSNICCRVPISKIVWGMAPSRKLLFNILVVKSHKCEDKFSSRRKKRFICKKFLTLFAIEWNLTIPWARSQ